MKKFPSIWALIYKHGKLRRSRLVQHCARAHTHQPLSHPRLTPPGFWLRPVRQDGRRRGCRDSPRGRGVILVLPGDSGSPEAAAWSAGPCRPLWVPAAWSQSGLTQLMRLPGLWRDLTEERPPWVLWERKRERSKKTLMWWLMPMLIPMTTGADTTYATYILFCYPPENLKI